MHHVCCNVQLGSICSGAHCVALCKKRSLQNLASTRIDKADQALLLATLLGNTFVCCTDGGGALQPDTDCSATTVKRRMHKVPVYAVGGDYADNGVDQLIIDGEAMPVLKALIREGKTPGVREGAVRLLTRLCTTPEARQEVISFFTIHFVFRLSCQCCTKAMCCIAVLLLLIAVIMTNTCLSADFCLVSPPGCQTCNPAVMTTLDAVKDTQVPMHKRRHVQGNDSSLHCLISRQDALLQATALR